MSKHESETDWSPVHLVIIQSSNRNNEFIIQHLSMEMSHVQLWINLVLNVAMTVTMDINSLAQTLGCVKSLVPGPVSNQSANWSNVDHSPPPKMVSLHVLGKAYA